MKSAKIFSTILLAIASQAVAQDLNKEITIDRDIVPEQRAAVRPSVFPAIAMPQTRKANPAMLGEAHATAISPAIASYEPAATLPAFAATPFRGYVDLGYFPTANVGLSAGYAIIDREKTRLNAWLQLDNSLYKAPKGSVWDTDKLATFDIAGGFSFGQKFGKHNRLALSAYIAGASTTLPGVWDVDGSAISSAVNPTDKHNFSNLRFHFKGSFDGRINQALTYGAAAGYGLFSNSSLPADIAGKAQSQNIADLAAYLRGQVSDNASLGIRVEGRMLTSNSFLQYADLATATFYSTPLPTPAAKTIGQIDFIPAAEYNAGSFFSRVGARLGVSVNSGKTFHIAPDVLLGVNPDDRFGAWLKFGGGVHTNSLEEAFNISRYSDPRIALNLSNIPVNGQLGLRVGPFYGASLTLTADYAAANNWLMPVQIVSLGKAVNTFSPEKIRSWKVGAQINWSYRSIVKLALSYDATLGDGRKNAWLYWRDRARHVIGATASVTPISPLTVDLGFSARLDRKQAAEEIVPQVWVNDQDYYAGGYRNTGFYSLGDLTNLWAGASWRFNSSLSVFARFDNILSRRSSLIFNVPSQGFTGLFGVNYKF